MRFSWTQDMRRQVCRRLLERFGTFDTWGQGPRGGDVMSPQGRDSEFQSVLEDLAREFGAEATKWTAIRQQVRWGLTRQTQIVHQGHFQVMVLNKAAAIEVGLLRNRDMPTSASLFYQPNAVDDGSEQTAFERSAEVTDYIFDPESGYYLKDDMPYNRDGSAAY